MQLEIKINRKDGQYQATAPAWNVHAFGATRAKAIVRLKLILRFYLDTAREMGYEVEENQLPPSVTAIDFSGENVNEVH